MGMGKKTQIPNDNSQLSSPGHSFKRKKPTEATCGSPSTSSLPSKTPTTRYSTRKRRSITNATAMEDSSESDSTPPPSIASMPSVKKRVSEQRTPRKSSNGKRMVAKSEVIDLTDSRTLSHKPSKGPKVFKPLDSFINLCSDEETNPQKKRRVIPKTDVILISSDDEAQLPGKLVNEPTLTSLEHAAKVQSMKKEGSPEIDPVASNGQRKMSFPHGNPDGTTSSPTPPPVSPPENDGPESTIVDIVARQDMMCMDSNSLDQESANPPARLSAGEDNFLVSFPDAPPEAKQPSRKVVFADQPTKPALLTPLFFARAMKSLGTTRPAVSQSRKSPKVADLVKSCTEANNLFNQNETMTMDSQNTDLDAPTSAMLVALQSDFPNVPILNVSTHEDIGASPTKKANETLPELVFSVQPKPITDPVTNMDDSFTETAEDTTCGTQKRQENDAEVLNTGTEVDFGQSAQPQILEKEAIPSSLANAILQHRKSTSPVPASESITALEDVFGDTHTYNASLDTHREAPVAHVDEPLIYTTTPETPPVLDESLDVTTSADSGSSMMEVEVELVSSVHFEATECLTSDTAVPPCVVGPPLNDTPGVESAEKEYIVTKACDASSPPKGQKDDLVEAEPTRNSETIIFPNVKNHSPSQWPAGYVPDVEIRVGSDPVQAYEDARGVSVDPTAQADRPQSRPTSPDTLTTLPDVRIYQDIQVDKTEVNLVHSVQLKQVTPLDTVISSMKDIDPTIFEHENLPKLTLQVLYPSNIILDDGDMTIPLPYYPDTLYC